MSFCLPTRRSFCLCVWTSWLRSWPVTFSMCQKRRWHLKPQYCGWINAPLVNRVLKRSDFTFEFIVALCKEQCFFSVLASLDLLSRVGCGSQRLEQSRVLLTLVIGFKLFPLQTIFPRCSSISDCLSSAHITSTMWLSLWMWWRRTQAARGSYLRLRTTFYWRTVVESFIAPERGRAGPRVNTSVQYILRLHCREKGFFKFYGWNHDCTN